MERRDALHAILGALALAPPFLGRTAEALASEAEVLHGMGTEVARDPIFLDAVQFKATGALVDTIIPKTKTPGARWARVHLFIDVWLGQAPAESQAVFVEGLRRLDRATLKSRHVYFHTLYHTDQARFVADIERSTQPEDRAFFALAKSLTVFGYYTSPEGLSELGWTAHHAPYPGCNHPEHGAESRAAPVKGRP